MFSISNIAAGDGMRPTALLLRRQGDEVTPMLSIILTVFFGFGFGFFALQNTAPVTIHFGKFLMPNIPLYLVALGSIFAGLFITGTLYIATKASALIIGYSRDSRRIRTKTTMADLEQKIRELEAANARLRSEHSPAPRRP